MVPIRLMAPAGKGSPNRSFLAGSCARHEHGSKSPRARNPSNNAGMGVVARMDAETEGSADELNAQVSSEQGSLCNPGGWRAPSAMPLINVGLSSENGAIVQLFWHDAAKHRSLPLDQTFRSFGVIFLCIWAVAGNSLTTTPRATLNVAARDMKLSLNGSAVTARLYACSAVI